MSDRPDARWRSITRSLQVAGRVLRSDLPLVSCTGIGLLPLLSAEVRQPERGLAAGLTWTHPVRYGSEQDERRSQRLFGLICPSFGLIISGEMIKICMLGDYSGLRRRLNPPWNPN